MAIELHVPPPVPPPPPGAWERLRRSLGRRRSAAPAGLLAPLLTAALFGLVAALLLIDQDLLRWTHRLAATLAAAGAGFGVSLWPDRAWMARRAAVTAALGAVGLGAAKWLDLELTLPGLGTLRFRPELGWPEAVLGVTALLVLLALAVLERRG